MVLDTFIVHTFPSVHFLPVYFLYVILSICLYVSVLYAQVQCTYGVHIAHVLLNAARRFLSLIYAERKGLQAYRVA